MGQTDDTAELIAAIWAYRKAGGEVPRNIGRLIDMDLSEPADVMFMAVFAETAHAALRDFACEVLADRRMSVRRVPSGDEMGLYHFLNRLGEYPTRTAALAAGLRLVVAEMGDKGDG